MTDIERYTGWLTCPDCTRDLDPVDDSTLGCATGHRFELGRRGYVGLTRTGERIPTSRSTGQVPDSLEVRTAVLAMIGRGRRILDARPGSGDLLAEVLREDPSRRACALSDSPAALGAVVSSTSAAGVLADTLRTWPLRDGAADVLLAIDAPLFPSEFHRALDRGGAVIAAPREQDMSTLVDDLYLWFEHDQSRPIPGSDRIAVRLRRRRKMLTW